MKRLFISFILFLFLFLTPNKFINNNVSAAGEFSTDFEVSYSVKESGVTEVTNKIILTNIYSNLYATSYSIVLNSIKPTNIKAYGETGPYSMTTTGDDKQTTIKIDFPDQMVGKDMSRIFYVTYEESSFAVRTGEVWEISIPGIAEDATFSTYNIKLYIPEKLGQEAYISPSPRDKKTENGFLVYDFNKDDVRKTGIVAGFGEFQVFSFNLSYHLENPLSKTSTTEITLPPDTAYQKVYYDNINPRPANMYVDVDGNWIAEYKLLPRERVDVAATGHVQIFSNYRPFLKPSPESLGLSLKPSEYWDIGNPSILALSSKLKTPREIYDFVSTKLKYDYSRVKPNVERLGAVRALQTPDTAICMEFTDLFVTLARAAGIPAREVNGFAYTENPEIQPLSLVNDVLHAWPEYYDREKAVWVPVDPTWGSTTGGVDYFNKLDLRHFTFVVHGQDSKTPYAAGSYKLGANPQKDVFVSFGSLPTDRSPKLDIKAKLESWIPLVPNKLDVILSNKGSVAIYNIAPKVYFDDVERPSQNVIEALLPFQEYKTSVTIPFSFLAAKTPDAVRIIANDVEITVPINKRQEVVYNLLFIFLIVVLVLVTILFRLKKISFDKIQSLWKFLKKTS